MEFCNCKFYMLIKLKIPPNLTLYFLVYISPQGSCENSWTLSKSISRPRPGVRYQIWSRGCRYDRRGGQAQLQGMPFHHRGPQAPQVWSLAMQFGKEEHMWLTSVYSTCLQHVAGFILEISNVSPWLENKSWSKPHGKKKQTNKIPENM